ncbi:ATP-binding cassette domain-containing protein, partial [bacterium]
MNAIEIQNLYKSFGGQLVLENVNLAVPEGKTLVIVGASGQGKSVLLKHMLGLLTPDDGKVMVLGKDVAALGRAELAEVRKNYGVLFQNAALLDSMNVFDNIALPLR